MSARELEEIRALFVPCRWTLLAREGWRWRYLAFLGFNPCPFGLSAPLPGPNPHFN